MNKACYRPAPPRKTHSALTRREWLGCGLAASGWMAMSNSALWAHSASSPSLPDITRSMLAITGGGISKERLENATALFGVILDTSKELRAIDLGDLEPATMFTHEIKGASRG